MGEAKRKFEPTDAQKEAIFAEEQDVLVGAAAGSGKTRVLVERLMEHVEKGNNLTDFAIITFTKAAAAELRMRILDELNDRIADKPNDSHLRRQTALVYRAEIGTIHSFCTKIIREFAHELDISPDFRVLDDTETRPLLHQVIGDVLELRYDAIDTHPGFARLVDTISAGRDDKQLIETVLDVHRKLLSHPYPEEWAKEQRLALNMDGKRDAGETIWGAYILDETKGLVAHWIRKMEHVRATMPHDPGLEKKWGTSFDTTLAHMHNFARALGESWDSAHACGQIAFPKPGSGPKYDEEKAVRDACKKEMDKIWSVFATPSRVLLAETKTSAPMLEALLDLVLDVEHAFSKEKLRRGGLSFADLEHLAVRLLIERETGAPSAIALEVAARFDEIMVDEFQDVSAIQDKLFCALRECGSRRFMVGDVKQSIYRFRLADPMIFQKYYDRFPQREGCKRVLLGQNFRSRHNVLDGVNFIFRRIMSRAFGELDYGDNEALYPGKKAGETPDPPVEFHVLDLVNCPNDGTDARDMAEARHVAAEILALREREGYSWRDFAILLRSVGSGRAARYEKALTELNIPVNQSGNVDFFYTVEVASVMSLLTIIINPQDDTALIGTMRSPLFAFTADELAEFRLREPLGSFYGALTASASLCEKCAEFLAKLNRWRDEAPDMAPEMLLWQLYQETMATSIFAAMSGGELRRANLLLLVNWASGAAATGRRGLFDFVMLLKKRKEMGDAPKGGSAQAGDSVTIMSVHKSKGLEFPVVFLSDLGRKGKHDTLAIFVHPQMGLGPLCRDFERKIQYPSLARMAIERRQKQETQAEELRILYVGMTRAEDRLILTGMLDNVESTRDKLVMDATEPVSPYALRGLSLNMQRLLLPVLTRPEAKALRGEHTVPLADAAYPWVVKWVDCGQSDVVQTANNDVVDKTQQTRAEMPDAEILRKLAFVYPHPHAVDLPGKLTATQVKGRVLDHETCEEAAELSKKPRTPIFRRPQFIQEARTLTGAERGTATHLVMQYINFSRCHDLAGVKAEIARLSRDGYITAEAAAAVDPTAVFAFFASPLGQRVLAAEMLKREFKFSLLVPAGDFLPDGGEEEILLQGVLDCYLEEPEGIVAIDFKTDYIAPGKLQARVERYRPQMEAYIYALQKITGRTVIEGLLYFFGTGDTVRV